MQNLENGGPNLRAGKCKTWKMADQITWLENAGPKMTDRNAGKMTDQIAGLENAGPGK